MSKSALAITEEHNDLADTAFGQLNRLGSRAAARATLDGGSSHPAEIWSAGTEIGWNGLGIAEAHGGSGFGLSELAVVLEAQGRELCPGPFLPTVAAAVVIDRCAPDPVRAQTLSALADGSAVGALALSGSLSIGSDLVLTGESPAVLGAPDADVSRAVSRTPTWSRAMCRSTSTGPGRNGNPCRSSNGRARTNKRPRPSPTP